MHKPLRMRLRLYEKGRHSFANCSTILPITSPDVVGTIAGNYSGSEAAVEWLV